MADPNDDWSDRNKPGGKKQDRKQGGGLSDLMRLAYPISNLASLKRGGKVRKTGPANLHKGERVIPAGKVKRVEKLMRGAKMRLKAGRR